MKITFAKPELPAAGVVALVVPEGDTLAGHAASLDERTGGALARAVRTGRFKGKKNQTLSVFAPAGTDLDRVVLVGLGKADEVDERRAQDAGGTLYALLDAGNHEDATVVVDAPGGSGLAAPDLAANLAYGAELRSFRFDRYRSKKDGETEDNGEPEVHPARLSVRAEGFAKARNAYARLEPVAQGVFLTRELVTEPANVIYPESMAERASELKDLGVEVEVLGEKEMKKLGMGALLAVGQGSARESKLVVLRWNGATGDEKPKGKGKGKKKDAAAPVAFVGKGVTFDSGGLSLKPAGGMEDMKWDMGGAGVVVGLIKALAGRKAKVDAVGVIGLVENMPSGTAQRPGDVVTSASGQTIEVLNTDAEGRLVLADALWYVQKHFKPRAVIDLATLTGAMIVSLGHERAGLFANDDDLATRIYEAGEATGDRVWRFPMGEEYDKQLKSDIADMQNIGKKGAGSITAAQFLKRFVNKDQAWAHLDIAGMAWSTSDAPTVPKGGTGFGVRLLDRLVADHYETRP